MPRASTTGISEVALQKMRGHVKRQSFYSILRRVNAQRQDQIADIMTACSDYTYCFLNLLIAASRNSDFVRPKRRMRGISAGEQADIERVFPPIEEAFRKSALSYADDARALAVTAAYVGRMFANPRIAAYVQTAHPVLARELRRLGVRHGVVDET